VYAEVVVLLITMWKEAKLVLDTDLECDTQTSILDPAALCNKRLRPDPDNSTTSLSFGSTWHRDSQMGKAAFLPKGEVSQCLTSVSSDP
jgi:hypothetical protein